MYAYAHWNSVEAFERHLASLTPPSWARGVTLHHTYRPLPSQWRGWASLEGLERYYRNKGWNAGPHLFLVVGAPSRDYDGIWQLTPLHVQGIHAGRCNRTHIGVEVCGDFDAAPWNEATKTFAMRVMLALLRWMNAPPSEETLRGHRECLPNKSCPGVHIDMDAVRSEAIALWNARSSGKPAVLVSDEDAIIAAPRCTIEQAALYFQRRRDRDARRYNDHDVLRVILPAYFDLCPRVGVDPCIAVAQMIHETGALTSFWSARPQRNPAGIGVTGQSSPVKPNEPGWAYNPERRRWEKGISFPSWANHSIPAHVGRLTAYAVKPEERTEAQRAIVAFAEQWRALPAHLHGSAPRLRDLNGKWAVPGERYGAAIAAVASAICAQRRDAFSPIGENA